MGGNAWDEMTKDKNETVRAFKKCGISVAADGSEDY